MQKLKTEFKSGGFDYKQHNRIDNVAVYEQWLGNILIS